MASNVDELVVITPLESRRFPESVDFVTSPDHGAATESRRDIGLAGGGPSVVVTAMVILEFDSDGEMNVEKLYSGVDEEEVKAKFDWGISVSEDLGYVAEPPASHSEYVRENDL
jgi:glutaconate CoA-transferase subunit B